MINNIRISELPVLTSPSLSGVTTITFGNTTYQTSLQNLLNVLNNAELITPITHSEFFDSISGSTLVPGTVYRITDFKTVNFLNGYSSAEQFFNGLLTPTINDFNPLEIYTGDTEVILVTAVSDNEISPIGFSETYQHDIISYHPIENKIGVEISIVNGDGYGTTNFDLKWNGTNVYVNMPSGMTLSYGNDIQLYASFSGSSYDVDAQIDILKPCPEQNFDYEYGSVNLGRIIVTNGGTRFFLPDLTLSDYNNYDSDSLYLTFTNAIGDAYGRIYRRKDMVADVDVPFDFRGLRYRRFEVDLLSYFSNLGIYYYGNGENLLSQIGLTGYTGNYDDFPVFQEGYPTNIQWGGGLFYGQKNTDNNVFFGNCSDLKIENIFKNNTISNGFYQNKIGSYFSDNICGDSFSNNDIGDSFTNNIIEYGFGFNSTSNNFSNNHILYGFGGNSIGENFISNTIASLFYNNNILNDFQLNTISVEFFGNVIGRNVNNNTIGGYFNNNKIGNGFFTNLIGSNCYGNIIDDDFYENEIGVNFENNKIGSLFQNNVISDNFIKNIIGTDFYMNTIDDSFQENSIGNYFQFNGVDVNFQYNKITTNFVGNEIGTDFQLNNIDDSFVDNLIDNTFQYNNIRTNFTGNTIDTDFMNNDIGNNFFNNDILFSFNNNKILNNFYSNVIGNDFNHNEIGYDFHTNMIESGFTENIVLAKDVCNVDFQTATHVYNPYTCTLFKRQGGDARLSYYDSSDTLIITDVDV